MSKFKVGDKVVRVLKPFDNIKVGHIGIVTYAKVLGIKLDNDPSKSLLEPDYFKLYEEPKKKFSGKFRIKDEEHSRKVQEYLFSIGCVWANYNDCTLRFFGIEYVHVHHNLIYTGNSEEYFIEELIQEYTLKETTTYSLEDIPTTFPKIETIEILGKHYSKEDVEKAFSKLQEIVK